MCDDDELIENLPSAGLDLDLNLDWGEPSKMVICGCEKGEEHCSILGSVVKGRPLLVFGSQFRGGCIDPLRQQEIVLMGLETTVYSIYPLWQLCRILG